VEVVFDTVNFPFPEEIVAMVHVHAMPEGDGGNIKATFWDPHTAGIIAHGNHLFKGITRNPNAAHTTINSDGAPTALASRSVPCIVCQHQRRCRRG
jgi:hypothetical protein